MKVYTTIDLDKQQEAREAIADHLAGVGPSSAIVTINPRNGYIEAMASSASYSERSSTSPRRATASRARRSSRSRS